MTGLPVGPLGVVILIQSIWIILGCFIDWIGILLLTAPIFVPVALALGFDPVWLGVLFCMNMQISYISPPFGPAAFYLKGVTPPGITLGDIFGSIWPYLGLQSSRSAWSSPFRRSPSGCRARWRAETRLERSLDAVVDVMRVPASGDPAHAVLPVDPLARRARSPASSWSPAAAPAASPRRSPRRAAAGSRCSRKPTGSAGR